ncbi:MAG: AAA family ATPase, partial [Candidatus Methylumidiphilus sp.]
ALLMYLVRHGAIEEQGGAVFWDEPEANLNPKLIAKLAKILVALAGHGIQVNVATHSLFFLKEIDLQLKIASAKTPIPARFFALSDAGSGVQVSAGDNLEDIEPIAALDMEIDQADRYNAWLYQATEKAA